MVGQLHNLQKRKSHRALLLFHGIPGTTVNRGFSARALLSGDPSSSASISKLENIQLFALKLCSKNWSSNYPSLLQLFNCPLLSSRRTNSKLISLFKILHGHMFFPSNSFQPLLRSSRLTRSFHSRNLSVPHSLTSAYLSSFVPTSCRLLNSLPSSLKDCDSLGSFKSNLYLISF